MAQNDLSRPKTAQEAPPLIPETPMFYDQDKDPGQTPPKTEKKKKPWLNILLTAVFAALFLASGGMLLRRFYQDRQTENEFADMKSLIVETADSADTAADGSGAQDGEDEAETNSAKFAKLSARNSDFIGWLSIDGTNLDYPVMYHPSEKDYYLRKNFDGEYSNYGTPYLDEACSLDPRSDNWIIYGHNMKTGTIFGCLTEYKKQSYWSEHPVITLDTLDGDGQYMVFAAFAEDVATDTFLYNTYVDMDEETFNTFVSECKRRSTVSSDLTPAYGDELLTLSTCEYSSSNGRFVVCAVKIGE